MSQQISRGQSPAKNEPDRPLIGLSVKLIGLIIFVIMSVEVLIYLPSAANFKVRWLEERFAVAIVAVRVFETVPEVMDLSSEAKDRLLIAAGAKVLVFRSQGKTNLVELEGEDMPQSVVTIDMEKRSAFELVASVLDTLVNGGSRTLRVVGAAPQDNDGRIEILIDEAPLRAELLTYSRNIFLLSLLIAVMTALILFVALNWLLVRPIRRMTRNMIRFRQSPENAQRIIHPSQRGDEVGIAERQLAEMETDIFTMLHQRKHLADLGLAVAKINHDLRNTLTSAQYLSDQVAGLDDPKVQRLAPRLVTTLNKAVGFAQTVLDYGRERTLVPKPQLVDMRLLIAESALEAGLANHPGVQFENDVPDDLTLSIDPDQIARIFVNLLKNAREALEEDAEPSAGPTVRVSCTVTPGSMRFLVADNGPGLPPRALDNLFAAFKGSGKVGGTGLGLSIAKELAQAHGGSLTYIEGDVGTQFELDLPQS